MVLLDNIIVSGFEPGTVGLGIPVSQCVYCKLTTGTASYLQINMNHACCGRLKKHRQNYSFLYIHTNTLDDFIF